jgi:hypothetical protein
MRAAARRRSGRSASRRSRLKRAAGPEMLIAATTRPVASRTGAARQRTPISRPWSSNAQPASRTACSSRSSAGVLVIGSDVSGMLAAWAAARRGARCVSPPSGEEGHAFGFTRGDVAMQIADPRLGTGRPKGADFERGGAPPKQTRREVLFTGFAWAIHAQAAFAPAA